MLYKDTREGVLLGEVRAGEQNHGRVSVSMRCEEVLPDPISRDCAKKPWWRSHLELQATICALFFTLFCADD